MTKNSWQIVLKEVVVFWLIAVVATVLVLSFFSRKRKAEFNPQIYEQMLTGESAVKAKTDNPCQYSIIGDPNTQNYVKVVINCRDGSKSSNTLSLEAIKQSTVRGVLTEFGRINGFEFTPSKRWNCELNLKPVIDWNMPVTSPADLVCTYD